MMRLTLDGHRATIHNEGGISYEAYINGVGWVLDDDPPPALEMYAFELQRVHQYRLLNEGTKSCD